MVHYQYMKKYSPDLNGTWEKSPQSCKISKFSQNFHFSKSQNSCLKEYNSICKNYGKQKFLLLGPAPFLEKLALKVCLTILVYYALKRNHVTKE